MSLAFADTVTVVRRSAAAHPNYGDAGAVSASTNVKGCAIWPTTSTETLNGVDTVVWGLTVLMPPGTDVLATDQIDARGVLYDVNGQPTLYKSPLTGRESGIEVILRASTG